MQETSWQKIFRAFLHSIRSQLILSVMALICFGLVAFLTRYSFSFFGYSSLLFLTGLSCYLLFQWNSYIKRYRILKSLQSYDLNVLEEIPVISDPAEILYQEKLHDLKAELHKQQQSSITTQKEQMDYFTLWLHQIKTPIAAMSLLNQRLPSSAEKRQMEQELLRVEDYTHMALNYLKLEGSNQELDLTEIDVDSIIRQAIKKYAILFIYNEIQLDYQPTNLKVVTDGKWLEVLLEQILSNSLKYTSKGKVSIYADPDRKATLLIEDNGTGIRAEDLPKIFEKGYSGWNGRLQEKSTGLGLFLSRKICQRLGHTMEIDSKWHAYTKVALHLEREELPLYD